MSKSNALTTKALDKAAADIASLLTEHQDDIAEAMGKAAIESESDKPIKFRVGLSIVLNPTGTECGVACKISYGTKRQDASEASVTLDLPLPGMEGK
jgi:hypothetical protein